MDKLSNEDFLILLKAWILLQNRGGKFDFIRIRIEDMLAQAAGHR